MLFKNKINQVTPEKTPEVEFRDEPIFFLTYKGVKGLKNKKM